MNNESSFGCQVKVASIFALKTLILLIGKKQNKKNNY